MDEMERGQELLARRRRENAEALASDRTEMVPEMVAKFYRESRQKCSETPTACSTEPENSPEPRQCPYCEQDVPWLEVTSLGRTRWAPLPCECAGAQAALVADLEETRRAEWQRYAAQLLHDAGMMTNRPGRMSFETWDEARNPPMTRQAIKTVRAYVAAIEKGNRNWLFLHGPYGVGKTHLALAAARQLTLEHLWRPVVVNWPEHCQQVQESWNSDGGPTEGQLWGNVRRARVLVIDDLDKRTPTAWAIGKLYEVLEARYMREMPTILTANHDVEALGRLWSGPQIEDIGAAILSRIVGSLWGKVPMQGKDQRWPGKM